MSGPTGAATCSPESSPLDTTDLVGPDRIALVGHLASRLSDAIEERRPQVVVLEGDMGVGKSRLLRELYKTMAATQAFWPASLDAPTPGAMRDQLDAGTFVPESGEAIPWLWWPVSCGMVRGVPMPALSGSAMRLHDRLEHALARPRRTRAQREFLVKLTLFGISVVPLGNLATVGQVLGATGNLVDTERSARRLVSARRVLRSQRVPEYAVPSGERSYVTLVQEIVSQLAELGREQLPVVMVVDDAHYCDDALLRLLESVIGAEAEIPFLCVCTQTPGLARAAGPQGFADWVDMACKRDPERVTRQHVGPLPNAAIELLVRRLAPGTEEGTVAALAARADGNPLVLRGLLSHEVVEQASQAGAFTLSQRDIAGLPNSHRDQFRQRWQALPGDTRLVLSLAALQGRIFVRQLVTAGAPGALSDPVSALKQLPVAQALGSRDWVSETLPDHAFTEQIGFELAIESVMSDHILGPHQLEEACTRIAACITGWKNDAADWKARDPELQLLILEVHVEIQRHLRTAHLGLVDVVSAVDSALTVGRSRRLRTDARAALPVLRDAITIANAAIPDHPVTGAAREHLAATLTLAQRHEEALEQRRLGLEARHRTLGRTHPLSVEAEAEFAVALGRVRRHDEALEHHLAVFAAVVELYGEDGERASTAQQWVASSLENLARYDEALDRRRSIYELLVSTQGAEAAALGAGEQLASAFLNLGSDEAARELLEQVLSVRLQRFGSDEVGALSAHRLLGDALTALQRDADALVHRRRVLELSSAFLGASDESTLAARASVAESLDKLGNAGARTEWTLATQGYERRLGAALPSEECGLDSAFQQIALRGWSAHCWWHLGRAENAAIRYRANLEQLEALLGEAHLDTLQARAQVAEALCQAEQYDEALPLLRRVLRDREATLGTEHKHTLNTCLWLGFTLRALKAHEQAVALFERALAGREAALGRDHLDTLDARKALGVELFELERYDDALRHFEALLDGHELKLGPDCFPTLKTRHSLGSTLYELDRLIEAAPHFAYALEGLQAMRGPNDPETLTVAVSLGDTLVTLGRPDEALPVLELAQSGRAALLGPVHLDTLYAGYWRSCALNALGRHEEARPLLEQVLSGREAKLGPDDLSTMEAAGRLGITLSELELHSHAVPAFEKVLKGRGIGTALRAHNVVGIRDSASIGLGQALFKLKRYGEALPVLERLLRDRTERFGAQDPGTLGALDWLGGTLFELQRFEEALAAHLPILAHRRQALGPSDAATLVAMSWVGKSHYLMGDYHAANAVWKESLALCSAELGPDHPRTVAARKWLARTVERMGNPEDPSLNSKPDPRSSSTTPLAVRFDRAPCRNPSRRHPDG